MSRRVRESANCSSPRRTWLGRPQFSLAALLVGMVPLSVFFIGVRTYLDGRPIAWEEFSQARMDNSLKEGRVVLVDLWAAWNITTATHSRFALETPAVRRAIRSHGVVPLRLDFTDQNHNVAVSKARLGASSVPTIVICRRGSPPIILSGMMITEERVLDALKQSTRNQTK